MKKRKFLYIAVIILTIVVSIVIIDNIKICSINSKDANDVYELLQSEFNIEEVDICILDYEYITGASWRVEKSTNRDLENEYVCLNTIYNPRLLKINKEFDLDYTAKYVAVIDRSVSQTRIDNEDVDVLKVKEFVITNFYYQNDGFEDLRFGDLTFEGKWKSMMALFVPKFRLQM